MMSDLKNLIFFSKSGIEKTLTNSCSCAIDLCNEQILIQDVGHKKLRGR